MYCLGHTKTDAFYDRGGPSTLRPELLRASWGGGRCVVGGGGGVGEWGRIRSRGKKGEEGAKEGTGEIRGRGRGKRERDVW